MTTIGASSHALLSPASSSPDVPDLEAGAVNVDQPDKDQPPGQDDPFNISNTKNVRPESLRRWRQAALVLNASRRFRYTLDLKREEERDRRRRMIRSHAQVIRAALLFKLAAERQIGTMVKPQTPIGDFGITLEELVSITKDNNFSALHEHGGVKGLSVLIKTNLETGIDADESELTKRRDVFGTNTYPRKKGRSIWRFIWEAGQDRTLIILIVAALLSLVLGIKTEGLEEGWYDGSSRVVPGRETEFTSRI